MVRIVRRMNAHDAMTVQVEETNENRQIVDYASDELKTTLRALPSGTTVPIEMEPIATRGNAWRAVGL